LERGQTQRHPPTLETHDVGSSVLLSRLLNEFFFGATACPLFMNLHAKARFIPVPRGRAFGQRSGPVPSRARSIDRSSCPTATPPTAISEAAHDRRALSGTTRSPSPMPYPAAPCSIVARARPSSKSHLHNPTSDSTANASSRVLPVPLPFPLFFPVIVNRRRQALE
jgi:hypothetical protein